MRANELMIGDWVKFADNVDWADGLNGKPVQVEGLRDDDAAIKVYDPRPNSEFRDFWSDDEDDFEPIPLTDEILKKNGWEIGTIPDICNGTEDWAIWPVDSEIEIPFRLQRGYDGHRWWIVVGIGGLLTHIDYVHEFQHALRLCGIEKDIVL